MGELRDAEPADLERGHERQLRRSDPFSKQLADEAGEASAQGDGVSGPRQRFFEAKWRFAATVPAAEQPVLQVVASPDRGDGARMNDV